MRRILLITLILSLIGSLMLLKGLWWLVVLFCLVFFFSFIIYKKWNIKSIVLTRVINGIRYLIFVPFLIIVGIIFRVFIFEIYAIPSGSMENTLIPGDKVLVNKLAFGPMMPESIDEIPWVNLIHYLFFDSSQSKSESWGAFRFGGYADAAIGDVFVFYFDDHKIPFIKRCMALPGDTIVIGKGKRKEVDLDAYRDMKLPVSVITSGSRAAMSAFRARGIYAYPKKVSSNNDEVTFSAIVSVSQFDSLVQIEGVDSVLTETEVKGIWSPWLRAMDSTWTIYDFGPIKVPHAEMEIALNEANFILYGGVINKSEGVGLSKSDSSFYIDGVRSSSYTFKKNYYFMMGDNRGNSQDSRYNGFVEEDYLVGRADIVLFSSPFGGFDWKRLMKKVK